MLTARQRRQIYEWLLRAFGDSALDHYSLVDPARLRDISRALEETGAADWEKRYKEVLKRASARINISCTGSSGAMAIKLELLGVGFEGGSVPWAARRCRSGWSG